jgi:hypothetical protein
VQGILHWSSDWRLGALESGLQLDSETGAAALSPRLIDLAVEEHQICDELAAYCVRPPPDS